MNRATLRGRTLAAIAGAALLIVAVGASGAAAYSGTVPANIVLNGPATSPGGTAAAVEGTVLDSHGWPIQDVLVTWTAAYNCSSATPGASTVWKPAGSYVTLTPKSGMTDVAGKASTSVMFKYGCWVRVTGTTQGGAVQARMIIKFTGKGLPNTSTAVAGPASMGAASWVPSASPRMLAGGPVRR